jgi:membrane-bound lytic murein transglycosylase MltF
VSLNLTQDWSRLLFVPVRKRIKSAQLVSLEAVMFLRGCIWSFAAAVLLGFLGQPVAAIETGRPFRENARLVFTGDFDAMERLRRVRILIPFNKAYFHLDGHEMGGIAVEQLRVLEKEINRGIKNRSKRIFVILIPTPRDRLLPDLVAGHGDIALGNLTITPERRTNVDFSDPLVAGVDEVLVTRTEIAEIRDPLEFSGKAITVRRSSSAYTSLEKLNAVLAGKGRPLVDIRVADERLETDDLIEMVRTGQIDATIADSHVVGLWTRTFPDIRAHMSTPVQVDQTIGWAFRKNSPKLAAEVNAVVAKVRAGTEHGNILLRDYAKTDHWAKGLRDQESRAELKQYAQWFRKYGEMYKVDPYLIAAVAYQESRFDPKLVMKGSGATGLLQMMPSTARLPIVGITNLTDPENNIHAFAKYFRHLQDKYINQPELTDIDGLMLVLASYNAGPTKISRLRKKAMDPNVWFESVEWEVWRSVGAETVDYVRSIFRCYIAIHDMQEMNFK